MRHAVLAPRLLALDALRRRARPFPRRRCVFRGLSRQSQRGLGLCGPSRPCCHRHRRAQCGRVRLLAIYALSAGAHRPPVRHENRSEGTLRVRLARSRIVCVLTPTARVLSQVQLKRSFLDEASRHNRGSGGAATLTGEQWCDPTPPRDARTRTLPFMSRQQERRPDAVLLPQVLPVRDARSEPSPRPRHSASSRLRRSPARGRALCVRQCAVAAFAVDPAACAAPRGLRPKRRQVSGPAHHVLAAPPRADELRASPTQLDAVLQGARCCAEFRCGKRRASSATSRRGRPARAAGGAARRSWGHDRFIRYGLLRRLELVSVPFPYACERRCAQGCYSRARRKTQSRGCWTC